MEQREIIDDLWAQAEFERKNKETTKRAKSRRKVRARGRAQTQHESIYDMPSPEELMEFDPHYKIIDGQLIRRPEVVEDPIAERARGLDIQRQIREVSGISYSNETIEMGLQLGHIKSKPFKIKTPDIGFRPAPQVNYYNNQAKDKKSR